MVEDNKKSENFDARVDNRVNAAIQKIDQCQHLANKINYDYSVEDSAMVVFALESAVNNVRKAFLLGGPPKKFSLRGDNGIPRTGDPSREVVDGPADTGSALPAPVEEPEPVDHSSGKPSTYDELTEVLERPEGDNESSE